MTGLDDDRLEVERRCDELLGAHTDPSADPELFLGAQFDLGLAWVHFPVGDGGLGLAPGLQHVIERRLEDAGAPNAVDHNILGHGMAAPTIVAHGSAAQRQRLLRPLFTGEEVWCQLFSEPGAGSDLAGLATSAVRDGEEWIVNGQKVWTTLGHLARWGLLVARTDATVPKHRGLSYFLLDMGLPGVSVQPLVQMTGEAEFNEVYLTDVRVPDDARLGDVGDGWRMALTTLMNERVAIGGRPPRRGDGFIGHAMEVWHAAGVRTDAARSELADLWIRSEVLRLTNLRAAAMRSTGTPGPEGSIGKVITATLNQRIASFVVDLLGAEGMLKPGGYPMHRPQRAISWLDPQQAFLRSRANSIEGGTTEIAKNVLAERVLGLPGEARNDKDLPWRDVPRS